MDIEGAQPQLRPIGQLVDLWDRNDITVDHDYQRGAVWKRVQQQRLVDSVFRGYPLPLFYFHKVTHSDIDGNQTSRLEVIDGQQRLRALSEYRGDKYPSLDRADAKLVLPDAIRQNPCPWGARRFSDLDVAMSDQFLKTQVSVIFITRAANPDEIRDLFIRLQAGTALTRQQVRDAWPGAVSEYVVQLAGKVERGDGRFTRLFRSIDKRGQRRGDSEVLDEDRFHDDRQTCAQLLWLFLRRRRSPREFPSVLARDLDTLYHTETSLDPHGTEAADFERVLAWCEKVLGYEYYKPLKNDLFSLFLMFTDLQQATDVNVDSELSKIRACFENRDGTAPAGGKVASAGKIAAHYEWFLDQSMAKLVIAGLDPQRAFTEAHKNEIWNSCLDADGIGHCAVCGKVVDRSRVEFDHVLPWIRGGRTIPANGRVVHVDCHARGRTAAMVLG